MSKKPTTWRQAQKARKKEGQEECACGCTSGMNRQQILREERKRPPQPVLCQFTEGGRFLGAVFLQAHGVLDAVDQCWKQGINPGGRAEVCSIAVLPGHEFWNRLLSHTEFSQVQYTPPTPNLPRTKNTGGKGMAELGGQSLESP